MRQRRERSWWESDWINNKESWRKGARMLHLQFDQASKEKLKRIIEEAYGRKENPDDVE